LINAAPWSYFDQIDPSIMRLPHTAAQCGPR
jgi:hypothetical protein